MPTDQYDQDVRNLLERIAMALEAIARNTAPVQQVQSQASP